MEHKEDILLVVDPFGFSPTLLGHRNAKEYCDKLEQALSSLDRDLVQVVLLSYTLNSEMLEPFWYQERALVEKGFFDDIINR